MGSLKLDETLEPGEYRPLTVQELEGLQNSLNAKAERRNAGYDEQN